MKAVLLTSSAMILALLLLRRLFRKTLSRRVQYALWGLVLLRLLVPVSLPSAGFSLLTAAEPVVEDLEALYLEPQSVTVRGRYGGPVIGVPNPFPAAVGPATPDNSHAFSYRDGLNNPVDGVGTYKRQILLEDLLSPVWHGGMAVMACWLVFSNLRFWLKLRKHRRPYAVESTQLPVYLVERGLPSPCLFGLFRPAIYLTPAALASPDSLRHVLAHEETHAKHLDPLWSLLRGVCLTVYWFDPLVWWAALASRTDCELACDEGALRRLGEDERIPYGRTLLSLIPVRRVPADPFLAATTMTSDKRRLMDRVTRIAENRRGLGPALFAAVALAALVCAVTFTGAKGADSGPLTQEELDYFNGEFFTEVYGQGENRRAQFLTTLYDSPQNIDLYEVLYNGTGLPEEITDVDRKYIGDRFGEGGLPEDGYIKLSVTNIEAFLLENTGVSARDNHRYWQGGFWWNEENAAYYNIFADSGPRRSSGPVVFTSGQREGNTVRLYYWGTFSTEDGDHSGRRGPACLALLERPEGGWWFVSNEWALTGQVSAAPNWEPIFTIPLGGLEPYEPERQYPLSIKYEDMEMLDSMVDPYGILGEYSLFFYKNRWGRVYAGVQNVILSSWPPAFLELPGNQYSVSWFRDLLGHDGFAIHCDAQIQVKEDPPTYSFNGYSYTNYYYLDDGGRPVLLASVPGLAPTALDLDGDGERELVSWGYQATSLCFRRDGKYYQANIEGLLKPFWPSDTVFFCDTWDTASRSLSFSAWLYGYSSLANASRYEYRTLYFDGENLLVYNDQRHFANHMVEGFDLPPVVRTAALEAVEQPFRVAGAPYDDWRITDIVGANPLEVDGQRYWIWRISCEFHTPEPREMPGLDAQDCWADPFYPKSLYLVFRDNNPDAFQTDLICLFSMPLEDWSTEEQLSERLERMPDAAGWL